MDRSDALRQEAEALRLELTTAHLLAPRNGRLFYPLAALLLVVLMFWGFRHYYFHRQAYPGRPLTAGIHTLLVVHGTAMAGCPKQFLVVPFSSILIFGILVTLGVLNRHRPLLHRPLMLLATLAVMPAAVSRIDVINHLYEQTVWQGLFGPYFGTLVLALLLLVLQRLLSRSWDRVFALGCAGLVAASALIMAVATTRGWDGFAGALLR